MSQMNTDKTIPYGRIRSLGGFAPLRETVGLDDVLFAVEGSFPPKGFPAIIHAHQPETGPAPE
jgi:hypothetical protein